MDIFEIARSGMIKLPFFPGGIPYQASEDYEMNSLATETIEVEKHYAEGADFVFRHPDDSMTEKKIFQDFNIVLKRQKTIEKDKALMVVNTVSLGTLCRLVTDQGDSYKLEPANPLYKTLTLKKNEVHILGKVLAVFYKPD